MYTIEKIPSPTGYYRLKTPVEVRNIYGIDNVYIDDGELRGRVSQVPNDGLKIKVIYKRYYNDDSMREFITNERVTAKNNTFSLSKAPILSGKNKSIIYVDITVEGIK